MSSGPAFEVRGPESWLLGREGRPLRSRGGSPVHMAPVAELTAAADLQATVAALVDAVDRLERVVATLASGVGEASSASHPPADPSPLTRRQLEILRLLAGGRSTDDVARELFLSRPTVRNHVARTLRALGAHTRLEAVAIARDRGLL